MPWLMKAEPDSRVVKGKDVKFSVDDFEKLGVSPWDGVRNHEAKKIMKERMKIGDKVLFYHSNCKVPGVFAIAEVVKEGYPDYTAWDPDHPYYDPKTKKDQPTWFMVNVKFIQRLDYPPTLSLIKYLASLSTSILPDEISYIGKDGSNAIGNMQLVNRGRLSVQPVEQSAYDAIILLGTQGGWESLVQIKKPKSKSKVEPNSTAKREIPPAAEEDEGEKAIERPQLKSKGTVKKDRASPNKTEDVPSEARGERRSKRLKK
ncbi:uncharacterized protein IL334_007837 [Kwoniella shivajii]|uniref:EVE domain-containing protein n=1 Tax=Kwoniella shivajii TaxID=564305 RepID=A0ABZ1D9S7_9TREE|nr:hypothetical protein IL334_007837 [Kwoniella shivajii]